MLMCTVQLFRPHTTSAHYSSTVAFGHNGMPLLAVLKRVRELYLSPLKSVATPLGSRISA